MANVTVDRNGIVRSVWGRWLQRDGQVLLHGRVSRARVLETLGRPVGVRSNNSFCAHCWWEELVYPGGLSVNFSDLRDDTVTGFRVGER
ncbi:MAG: hypothetical protein AB1758_05435 [Candidatus Eremiobacterota bacterium]